VSNDVNNAEQVNYDPASMATSSLSTQKAIWYKRPWFLITVAIVMVVAISIVSDLPRHITVAQDTAAQNSAMKQINIDIKPCTFGLQEAVGFYHREQSSHLTAGQMKVITTYLVSDQTVCSFAGPSMSQLTNNLQLVDTPAGKYLEKMRAETVTWMDSDANGVIYDIWYLSTHHSTAKILTDLQRRISFLAQDRQVALADLASADAILGTTLTMLNLPSVSPIAGL
jgi:hypothetical protein